MSNSNQTFKPGDFMYLNPEVVVSAGLCNIWLTKTWAASNSLSNYFYDLNLIPNQFDANVFVCSSETSTLNLSPLNQSVYQAMLVEGMGSNDILRRASCPSTIMKNLMYLGNGIFDGGSAWTGISSNVIRVGDVVQLRGIGNVSAQVISLGGSQVELSNIRNTRFGAVGSKYVVIGIELFDVQRIAVINYLRLSTVSNSPIINYYQDTQFNPDLYRLLYSDSRNLSDRDAYLQYVALGSNNIRRIAKADDIPACNETISYTENISVAQELNLTAPTSSFHFKNTIVYGISQDDLSTAQLLYPSQAYPKLITEYAIKTYIDRPYLTTATFSNADFYGTATFYGAANFPGTVAYRNVRASNVRIDESLCNLGNGYHYGSNWFYAPSNYFTCNVLVGGTVSVSSNVIVQGSVSTPQVMASNAALCNAVTAKLFAIEGTTGSLCNLGNGYHYGSNWFYASSNYFTSNILVGGTVLTNNLSVSSNVKVGGTLQVQSNISTPCNLIVGNTVQCCNLSTATISASTSSILDGVVYIRKIAIM
jgi:hypothetical protein